MECNIFIKGPIGSDDVETGVELIDVISQVKAYPNASRIVVNIDSPGGYTKVGHSIAQYLTSLSTPVDTVADGLCASIASRIFMIGQNRTIISGTQFLIHNPWMATEGDADHMQEAADFLKSSEDELIKIYAESTGISKDGIDGLMKTDVPMTAEKAFELGFATAIKPRMNAVAKYKLETKTEMNNTQKSGFMKGLKALGDIMKDLAGIPLDKNMMVKDDQGTELEIMAPDMSPATSVEVGSMVMNAGQPAEGTFTLPDQGVVIEVSMGIISTVTPIQAATTPAVQASAELEALKKENADLKSKIEESEKNTKEIEKRINDLTESLNKISSNHVPKGVVQNFRKEGAEKSLKDKMKEREDQIKANKATK